MKKIGIVTLNGYVNYGNRLQNYALQEIIRRKNIDVETIWVEIEKRKSKDIPVLQKVRNILFSNPIENKKRIENKIHGILYKNKLDRERVKVFRNFSKKHINETRYKLTRNSIPKDLNENFDYFIVGSDQVWNPIFRRDNPHYFLQFASPEKRIAYAPSFGTSFIPEEYATLYSDWLKGIECLSVREEAGKKIIHELTGRDAPVLVDPTLLLKREEWLKIEHKPNINLNDNILLTYFLGDVDQKIMKQIKKIAKRKNLKIINLSQPCEKESYLCGPSEFIYLINNAELFITDSFHGAVFSILLETPFVVTERKSTQPSMNSRIETLLKMFQLENRHYNNMDLNYDDVLFTINLKHVPKILDKERKKAHDFLNKSLKINEDDGHLKGSL